MYYLNILIADSSYHGNDPLTYSSTEQYKIGSIVRVPMRGGKVPGIVIAQTNKPRFAVKPILGLLLDQPIPGVTLQMINWFYDYYPATSGSIVTQFVPNNLLVKREEGNKDEKTSKYPKKIVTNNTPLPVLTKDQTTALQTIYKTNERTFLLHGDTGTGKTRVYIELAKVALSQGRSVIILTPEIGLTSQLAEVVTNSLQSTVMVIHSNLTAKERRIIWLKALMSTEPVVVIGPRSALFIPLKSVGLIIVDEAHDGSYKQDQSPRYSALRVAGKLAELHQARLVFGTATPLISEYYFLQNRQIPIIRLTQIATGSDDPTKIQVVDARDKEEYTKHSYLSNTLLNEISLTLERNEQSLVFLNRRGTARLVVCQDCGWQALCPRCNIPLTYHGDNHTMRCHTCGYSAEAVTACPVCKSLEIVFKSIGTKAVSSALASLFPQARIQRFDTDNSKDEKFEHHYKAVKNGEVDILVGTQLLIKGLDLPNLRTVGVVAADSSLYFPDYTAEEQTYQLITQVIGRVGRGHREGSIIIQTYNPEGRALTAALQKDWSNFYQEQLSERRQHLFPPFCFVLKLWCSRSSQKSAISASTKLIQNLKALGLALDISDPTPRFLEQVGGKFNWQIIVKSKQRSILVSLVRQLPGNWNYDLDPLNLL